MTSPTNQQPDLDAIEARANAATPGPWERYDDYGPTFFANTTGEYLRGVGDFNFGVGEQAEADEEFVKHAREDVPAIVAEVRRLRARQLTPSEYNAAWHAVEGAAGEEGADPGTVLHAVLDRLGIGWQTAAHPAVEEPHVVTEDCDPPHVRAARYEAAGDVMAASLVRDGFGDDEIADILARPTVSSATEDGEQP